MIQIFRIFENWRCLSNVEQNYVFENVNSKILIFWVNTYMSKQNLRL